MGVPELLRGSKQWRYCWLRRSLPWLSVPPSPRPLPMRIRQQTLLLTRGTDTTDGAATAATMAATTDPTDTMDTTARGLLMPSPLPLPTLLLTRLLTPGMDTTATATDPGDTTDPTDTATTTARGLLTPSPSPLPLLIPLPMLLLTPGTDTTDTVDGTDPTMATDTTDTGHTDMATGDAKTLATKLNIVLSLATNTTEDQFLQNISLILFFKYFVLFNRVPGFIFQLKNNKVVKN